MLICSKAFDEELFHHVVIKQSIRPFANREDAKRYCREFDLHSIVNHKNVSKPKFTVKLNFTKRNFLSLLNIF